MRIGLLSSFFFALTIAMVGCSGDDDADGDGGSGDGDGSSSSAGVVAISSVSPDHGPMPGGTLLTITGEGFLLNNAQPNTVIVGGIQCPAVQLINDNSMIVETPPGEATGAVDVIVYNTNGFDTGVGLFSYNPMPTITAVSPDNGSALGGETVTLTGSGFQALEAGTNLVFFGENEASDVNVASDTSMTVTTPPGEAFSLADVMVANANGGGERPQAYEYTAADEALLVLGRELSSSCGGCSCEKAGKPTYFGAPYAADEELNPDASRLYLVDPVTGAVTAVAETEMWMSALAQAPDGTMYGVTTGKVFEPERQRNLVVVNTTTGELTPVGATGLDYNTNGLTFVGPVLFGLSWRSGSAAGLHTINTATGEATGIGGDGLLRYGNGIEFDGTHVYNVRGHQLCTIDTATGILDPEACVDSQGNDWVRGLAEANGELYGASRSYFDPQGWGSIVHIDRVTGMRSSVAQVPGKLSALATIN